MKKDKQSIQGFISNIANKDYKQANESLRGIIEIKIKEQIRQCLNAKKN